MKNDGDHEALAVWMAAAAKWRKRQRATAAKANKHYRRAERLQAENEVLRGIIRKANFDIPVPGELVIDSLCYLGVLRTDALTEAELVLLSEIDPGDEA